MLQIDKYAYINKLKDVHPVEKVLLSFYLLLFALVVKDSLVSLVTFIVMSAFIVLAAKIPLSYYVKLLLLPSFFLFSGIVAILISFTNEQTVISHPIWSVQLGEWQVYVTKENQKRAVNLFFMVLGSVSCLYFLTLTTPLTAILGVLRKLKVPSLLLELISLTYRFIFVFLEASIEIYQAQSSRLGYITIRKGIQSLGLLISTLFSKMFQRTQQLSIAMNSRGYGEDISLLDESYRYSPVNWFIMIGIFTGMAILYVKFGGSL
jgi:cobalt/nickel transport system permease protein